MRESDGRTKKPPCVFCGQDNHGIWNCQKFQQINVGDRWKVAKEKCLWFRCLSIDCNHCTNFVGAVNELKEVFNQLDQEKIKRKTSAQIVKWLFSPPAGPHFGGVHEILVKAAKKAIYAVLSNSVVNDEELITIFTAVEGLLNSRLLTYQSADVCDIIPLTPNHFLLGQMGGQFAPEHVCEGFRPRQRWRKVQHLVSMVWQRWLKEYLPMLTARPK